MEGLLLESMAFHYPLFGDVDGISLQLSISGRTVSTSLAGACAFHGRRLVQTIPVGNEKYATAARTPAPSLACARERHSSPAYIRSQGRCCTLVYQHTTPLSAQLAERYMHKDLWHKTEFVRRFQAQDSLVESSQSAGHGFTARRSSQAITRWATQPMMASQAYDDLKVAYASDSWWTVIKRNELCSRLWRSTGELGRCAGCGIHPRVVAGPPERAGAGERRPPVAGGTGSRTGPTRTSGGTPAAGGTGPTNSTPRMRRTSRRHGGGAAREAGRRTGNTHRIVD